MKKVTLFFLVASIAVFGGAVRAADCSLDDILCVDDMAGPTQEYSTIQDAVDAAQPGDTILVYGGVYNEKVSITNKAGNSSQPFLLKVHAGDTVTISQASDYSIYISGTTAYWTIDGFIVTGGGGLMGGVIVYCYGVNHITIKNCEIYDSGSSAGYGILFYGGSGNSDVHNCVLRDVFNGAVGYGIESSDDGGNHSFYGNTIHNVQTGIVCVRSDDCKIHGNYIYNILNNNFGIYLRNTVNSLVYNNIIKDAGRGIHPYWNIAPDPNHESRDGKIYNNIIIDNTVGVAFTNSDHTGWVIENNIFYNDSTAIAFDSGVGHSYGYNCFYGCNTDVTGSAINDGGNIFQDPQFVASGNKPEPYYTLQGTSQCIDNGTDLSSFFVNDKLGLARPQGSAWDIGVYEYMSTTPTIRSNPSPTGTLSSGTNQTNISLETDKQAICRYTNTSNTNYTDMSFNFTYTNSTNHSTLVTDLENGKTYAFYVRCNSTAGYVNDDDWNITFSVGGHKADINDDGVISMKELIAFIGRWKANDGVTKAEVEQARDVWFTGENYS